MKRLVTLVVLLLLLPVATHAQEPSTTTDSKSATGLPLPRFASLHVEPVNLRTGPGTRYPIEWVYLHEDIPVEITAEFDIWRRIRDWEGSEGWVQKSALSGKRTAIITGGTHELRKGASQESSIVAYVEQGAIGKIKACQESWCEVIFGDHEGYMPKSDFWGAYNSEVFEE